MRLRWATERAYTSGQQTPLETSWYQGSASRARLVAEHRGFHRCVHTVCQSTRAALPRP
ncbi:uncharacterized protein LOC125227127 isoform X3 [Leguminivora glycinivorella]|uniref:uncharacterized protein LOC125227127 isoform X3 n=1 Tax=Leguminivora glycinivorella TaxID=1035111 RepID=UPI00200FB5EC|nr:uncharacterized protein LOC125227127 isoform X3 [Leguminivora glycinivorella]